MNRENRRENRRTRLSFIVLVCFCFETLSLPYINVAHAQPSEGTRENYARILNLIQQDNNPALRAIHSRIQLDEDLVQFNQLDESAARTHLIEELYLGIRFLKGDIDGHLARDGQVFDFCQNIDRQTATVRTGEVTLINPWLIIPFSSLSFAASMITVTYLEDPTARKVLIFWASVSIVPGFLIALSQRVRNLFVRRTYTTEIEREKDIFLARIEGTPTLNFPRFREVFDYVEILLNQKLPGLVGEREIEETVAPTLIGFDD